jgi:hypothetical protein
MHIGAMVTIATAVFIRRKLLYEKKIRGSILVKNTTVCLYFRHCRFNVPRHRPLSSADILERRSTNLGTVLEPLIGSQTMSKSYSQPLVMGPNEHMYIILSAIT